MTNPIRVLIGDDDPDQLEVVTMVLESHGDFEVTVAATAADVYAAAREEDLDIIISDFDYGFGRSDLFPDGVAIGVALREEGSTVPFVIYSGLERRSAAAEGFTQWLKDDLPDLPHKINDLVRGIDVA